MNQTCRVCGEPAAGFHFGAFTCEGCKSFFGRSYNNLSSITECKNNGKCIIDKKNRTTCKACRLRKCYTVGMSKGGSRYGRRSNWFKIHCLLQEHQQQALEAAGKAAAAAAVGNLSPKRGGLGAGVGSSTDFSQHSQHQHHQHQQPHQHPQNTTEVAQLAAAHGLLGSYPRYATHPHTLQYLPLDMLEQSNSAAAAAAAFISMMSPHQSAFHLPPHLLLPAAAAVAASGGSGSSNYYPNTMYRNRQSPDSIASAESQHYAQLELQRIHSATVATASSASITSRTASGLGSGGSVTESPTLSSLSPTCFEPCESPELSVSGDDDEIQKQQDSTEYPMLQQKQNSAVLTTITECQTSVQSSTPLRVTPVYLNNQIASFVNNTNSSKKGSCSPVNGAVTSFVPTPTPTPTGSSLPRTPEPQSQTQLQPDYHQEQRQHQVYHQHAQHHPHHQSNQQPATTNVEQTALAFAAKMQSFSPVSVCSIGGETSQAQENPIDLSMKATTIETTFISSTEEKQQCGMRRKFYQFQSNDSEASTDSTYQQEKRQHTTQEHEYDNCTNSEGDNLTSINSPSSLSNVKRLKLSSAVAEVAVAAAEMTTTTPATKASSSIVSTSYNNFTTPHGATSLHGIFVCV